MRNVIIIPLYKSTPNQFELISFNQCLKVLFRHQICIISYKEMDLSYYESVLNTSSFDYSIEYFDSSYFDSIEGYNKLMLSLDFYKRFKKYKYLLIYQLDAYVFRDELKFWCTKGYDYIGAPWFENYGSFEEGDSLWMTGNGGFSLRRTKRFIEILSFKGPVVKPLQIRRQLSIRNANSKLKLLFYFLFKCCGYENNVNFIINNNSENEDIFFMNLFCNSWKKLSIPPVDIAIKFSFEKSPQYLFNQNNKQLPFGCHAWEKYDYLEFWKHYIH